MDPDIITTGTDEPSSNKAKSLLNQIFTRNDSIREELVDFFDNLEIPVRNDQIQMILGVVRMLKFTADKIKIPMAKIVAVREDSDLKETTAMIIKSGHSRIPVYKEEKKQKSFTGLLYAKDLLKSLHSRKKSFRISDYMRPVKVIPESQSLLSLLQDMRLKRQHMMLTANEFGEITGLITMEDILEEIVGEIKDEYDSLALPVKEVGHHLYNVDGSINLTDLNKELMLNLPEEKFNTLAGYLLHELKGKISTKKEIVYGNVTLKIVEFEGSQITKVQIFIPPSKI